MHSHQTISVISWHSYQPSEDVQSRMFAQHLQLLLEKLGDVRVAKDIATVQTKTWTFKGPPPAAGMHWEGG